MTDPAANAPGWAARCCGGVGVSKKAEMVQRMAREIDWGLGSQRMASGRPIRLRVVATVAAAFILSACGSGSGVDAGSTDQGLDLADHADIGSDMGGLTELPPCDSNLDCGGGEICRTGRCRTACSTPDVCEGGRSRCDLAQGYCVQCTSDLHCGPHEACDANACVFHCRTDEACGGDGYCVLETGECLPRECNSAAECTGGFGCTHFVCVPIDEIICTANRQLCADDGSRADRCNADGTVQSSEACEGGSTCVLRGDVAQCAQVVCTPDERGCTDDFVAYACDSSGTIRSETSCASGQYCESGTCIAQLCSPGSRRCALGGQREICSASGSGYTAAPCTNSETCVAGACQAHVCAPGVAACIAGTVAGREVCASDGLSLQLGTCPGGQSCSGGSCLPQVCAPGTPECANPNASHVCTSNGLGYQQAVSCAPGEGCDTSTGLCGAWACTPGTATCQPGNVRSVCDADGLGQTAASCGPMSTCSAGVCAPWVCTPGAFECLGTGSRRVCNPDGLGLTPSPCTGAAADGYACTGAGVCTPRVCTPSAPTSTCGGPAVRQACAADGLGFVSVACPAGQGCNAGTCAVRCGDGIVGGSEQCDDGGIADGDGCSSLCEYERCGGLQVARSDWAQVSSAAPLRLSGTSFTIEAWLYANDYDQLGHNVIVSRRTGDCESGYLFSVQGNPSPFPTPQPRRLMYMVSALCAPLVNYVVANVDAPVGRWFHAAVTFNAGSGVVTLWQDGQNVGSRVLSAPNSSTNSPLRIGADTDGGSNKPWSGQIDDVRISNVVRYASNFVPIANMVVDSSTLAFWAFDEQSGNVAIDGVSAANNATLTAGAAWGTDPACAP